MRDGLELSITMGKSVHSPREAELPAFVTSLRGSVSVASDKVRGRAFGGGMGSGTEADDVGLILCYTTFRLRFCLFIQFLTSSWAESLRCRGGTLKS